MAAQSTSEHVCFNRPAARPLLSRRLHLRRRRLCCHGRAAWPIIVKSSRTGESSRAPLPHHSSLQHHVTAPACTLRATHNPHPTTTAPGTSAIDQIRRHRRPTSSAVPSQHKKPVIHSYSYLPRVFAHFLDVQCPANPRLRTLTHTRHGRLQPVHPGR